MLAAACVIRPSARSSSTTRSKNSACSGGVAYRPAGTPTKAVATPDGSNPGGVRCSEMKLMSSSDEPTSSTTDNATSVTMSEARSRPPRALDDPRVASLSVSTSVGFEA